MAWNRGFILPFAKQIDSMLPCVYWVIDRWGESENAASQKGANKPLA